MCVEYLFSYSDLDIENVPLIKFFTDRKLKSFMNTCSKLPVLSNETKLRKQEVNIEVLSEERVEKSLKDTNNRTEISKFAALPTKKLILHRFRSNVVEKYEVPLRERNNNCSRQVNFAEKQTEENTALVLQTRAKKYKRCNRVNKENIPKFSLNLEELNIKLDKDIRVPVVTQLHRDFLGAIDFDMYRIF
nr:PREDICTED: uncharacterized protein LOC105662476 [Megachile rotundata]